MVALRGADQPRAGAATGKGPDVVFRAKAEVDAAFHRRRRDPCAGGRRAGHRHPRRRGDRAVHAAPRPTWAADPASSSSRCCTASGGTCRSGWSETATGCDATCPTAARGTPTCSAASGASRAAWSSAAGKRWEVDDNQAGARRRSRSGMAAKRCHGHQRRARRNCVLLSPVHCLDGAGGDGDGWDPRSCSASAARAATSGPFTIVKFRTMRAGASRRDLVRRRTPRGSRARGGSCAHPASTSCRSSGTSYEAR